MSSRVAPLAALHVAAAKPKGATGARWRNAVLVGSCVLLLAGFVVLPLVSVFAQALQSGFGLAAATFTNPYALAAIRLTLVVTLVTVTFNTAFGVLAAWSITKYSFPGKAIMLTLIDLPLTVSPVVAGLAVLLVFGARSPLGAWLIDHGIKVAFAPPGIAIATIFVTLPYIARELIALMQEQGRDLEEASLLLGAGVWQTLWRVTLPGAKWALLNGILLCNARAMGEFGAVSVISGRIRGLTDTVPLHIEILYNEYNFVGAFALAAALSLATIALTFGRAALERAHRRDGESSGTTEVAVR
jgi:sulfate/thiosulfate transport system permease protein